MDDNRCHQKQRNECDRFGFDFGFGVEIFFNVGIFFNVPSEKFLVSSIICSDEP